MVGCTHGGAFNPNDLLPFPLTAFHNYKNAWNQQDGVDDIFGAVAHRIQISRQFKILKGLIPKGFMAVKLS